MKATKTGSMLALAMMIVFTAGIAFADDHQSVTIAKKEGIGNYLVDSKAMTLYYFKKDSVGKSVCANDCLAKWPVFYMEKPTASKDLNTNDFGVIMRDDGKKQTTFRGMPVYYFFKDAKPGDTSGQGVGNVWYVIDPAPSKQ